MDGFYSDLMQIARKPVVYDTFLDILLCLVPIWVAVMIGLVIGWSWRPRWTGLIFLGMRSKFRFLWTAPPGFGARRLWLAFTALSAFSVCRRLWMNFVDSKEKGDRSGNGESFLEERIAGISPSTSASEGEQDVVTEKDLEHLLHLLDAKVGDAAWQNLMERSTQSMTYQAWRHEPEMGPTEYRSRTVFEDATPELVRDFFWDDDFRPKWDPMLSYFKILEENPRTGTMIVHWIKKFPFFCSDREYIIGRRIWESGRTYYCVTKGVPYPALHKHEKPRRVELYYSSWCIRAVESRKGDDQLSCEVNLVHYKDMGIPKDVAKLGVRHGMWGAVKKLQSGMRTYQLARKSEASLSRSALMARINTKIAIDGGVNSLECSPTTEEKGEAVGSSNKVDQGICWKWVFIGGSVALVCGLHTGIIGKVLLFGAARRLTRR